MSKNQVSNNKNTPEIDYNTINLDETTDFSKFHSVLEYTPLILQDQFSGNPMMDELSIWGQLYTFNLIEKKDIKIVKKELITSIKYGLVSVIAASILNRGLTKINIKGFRFMRMNFILRLFIRFSIFSGFIYGGCVIKSFSNFLKLHYYFNLKYADRYRRLNITAEPLIMNPNFYTDPSYTTDEADSMKAYYDQVKQNLFSMNMQEKQMKQMRDAGKKI